jgi:hypothetical protein
MEFIFELIVHILTFIPKSGSDWFHVKLTSKIFLDASVIAFDLKDQGINILLCAMKWENKQLFENTLMDKKIRIKDSLIHKNPFELGNSCIFFMLCQAIDNVDVFYLDELLKVNEIVKELQQSYHYYLPNCIQTIVNSEHLSKLLHCIANNDKNWIWDDIPWKNRIWDDIPWFMLLELSVNNYAVDMVKVILKFNGIASWDICKTCKNFILLVPLDTFDQFYQKQTNVLKAIINHENFNVRHESNELVQISDKYNQMEWLELFYKHPDFDPKLKKYIKKRIYGTDSYDSNMYTRFTIDEYCKEYSRGRQTILPRYLQFERYDSIGNDYEREDSIGEDIPPIWRQTTLDYSKNLIVKKYKGNGPGIFKINRKRKLVIGEPIRKWKQQKMK